MFAKNEKKKSSAPFFLTVGARAVVGARSITKKGKQLIDKMMGKRGGECAKRDEG